MNTFVVENAAGDITDFASFYSLPSTVVNHKQYQSLYAAYSFYNVSERLPTLMRDMLTIAKQRNFDVFNALDLMDNKTFLKVLNICKTTNVLQTRLLLLFFFWPRSLGFEVRRGWRESELLPLQLEMSQAAKRRIGTGAFVTVDATHSPLQSRLLYCRPDERKMSLG